MAISDLARALPGLLLVGLAPGFALATLAAPSWRAWERLAAAPGLSAGAVGVTGLAMHDLRLPFNAATVAPLLLALALGAAVRARRARGRSPAPARGPALMLAAAAVAGLASAFAVVNAFHDQRFPVETDAPVHGSVAAAIARREDALPLIDEPVDHSAWGRPRTAFEAQAALVSELGGPAPADSMLPLVVLAALLLPLSLSALALEATGSPLVAGTAPLLGAAISFPWFAVLFGEFPLVVDSTLVVPVVLAAARALRDAAAPGPRDAALLALAATASIWVLHGLEAITALLVGGPFVASLVGRRIDRALLRRAGALLGACAAGALLVTALTRLPVPPAPVPPAGASAATPTAGAFSSAVGSSSAPDALRAYGSFVFPVGALLVVYALGIVACLAARRLRWALVAHLLALACFVDVAVTGLARPLWRALYPWSTADRLLGVSYWLLPLLMALGLAWAAAALRARRPRAPAAALAAATAVVLLAAGAAQSAGTLRRSVGDQAVVTAADLSVIGALGRALPPGSHVLGNGADAGQWVDVLTPDTLFFSKLWIQEHPADARLELLSGACAGTARADRAQLERLFTGVDAIFAGARQPHDGPHPLDARCLRSVPWLRTIAWADDGDRASGAFVLAAPPAS